MEPGETTEPSAEPPAEPATFDTAPNIGVVELDRYCTSCGYNLLRQPVRREPVTGLLLCRCPECGAFEPANQATTRPRSWFGRLVVVLWVLWIGAWGGLVAGSIGATVGLAGESLGTVSDYYPLAEPITLPPGPGRPYARTINFQYRLELAEVDDGVQLGLMLLGAALIGLGMTALTTVFVPHWSRKGYLLLANLWPLVALAIALVFVLRQDHRLENATEGLMVVGYTLAVLISVLAIVGGVLGVWLGRPVARQVVRLIVPPRARGAFAYLWFADGLKPPSASSL